MSDEIDLFGFLPKQMQNGCLMLLGIGALMLIGVIVFWELTKTC